MPTVLIRKMAELERLGLTRSQALRLLARSDAVKRAKLVARCLAFAWLHDEVSR